jgi:hypothetical protein
MADSERERLSELVHGLNDVELAMLLCLVASRHCILTTDTDQLPRLEHEVELVSYQLSPSTFYGLTRVADSGTGFRTHDGYRAVLPRVGPGRVCGRVAGGGG